MRTAPGAWRAASIPVVVAVPAGVIAVWAGVVCLLVAAGVVWFYRDPDRVPADEGIVAPADGKVMVVRREDGRTRLGVFMNVTDVHVNRAPVAGRVVEVERSPGVHRPAFLPGSSRNERVRIGFDGFSVELIAGSVARRITSYVTPGERVERGGRIGHIAFGSRVDVVLPAGVGPEDLVVTVGDRVRAGETVIAALP